MSLDQAFVAQALHELDRVSAELENYRAVTADQLRGDLSLRWTVERGLLAGLGLVFQVADCVLSRHLSPSFQTSALDGIPVRHRAFILHPSTLPSQVSLYSAIVPCKVVSEACMRTKVTRRLQTSIPAAIRRRLGIKGGDSLEWVDDGNSVRIVVVPTDSIEALRGCARGQQLSALLERDRKLDRSRAR